MRRNPVYRVLIEPILFMGVNKRIGIFNLLITFAFVMIQRWVWYLPIGILIHVVLRHYHKKEPLLLEVNQRFRRQGTYYDPWWHPFDRRYSTADKNAYRPPTLGRDLP